MRRESKASGVPPGWHFPVLPPPSQAFLFEGPDGPNSKDTLQGWQKSGVSRFSGRWGGGKQSTGLVSNSCGTNIRKYANHEEDTAWLSTPTECLFVIFLTSASLMCIAFVGPTARMPSPGPVLHAPHIPHVPHAPHGLHGVELICRNGSEGELDMAIRSH